MRVAHEQMLAMFLHQGAIEIGFQRSSIAKLTYGAGQMMLCHRHKERWFRTDEPQILSLAISDEALKAAFDDASPDTELRGMSQLTDPRVGALVSAANAERIAGFPSGRLFLDSIEQALAVTLIAGYAVRPRYLRNYQGGLGPARLRRINELVDAKMEEDLSLGEMAQSLELSPAHFARMFRRSTGETPHEFVMRQRVERAKKMLRESQTRVLDVAIACGFKTQQHFARVFRQMCQISPTEYRREFLTDSL
jgi:AraC family transcriptional regulator